MKFKKTPDAKFAEKLKGFLNQELWMKRAATIANLLAILGISYAAASLYAKAPGDASTREIVILGFAAGLLLFNQIQFFWMNYVRQESALIAEQANFDSLTGVWARPWFEKMLEEETRRASRYRHPLTLCLLDLDGFTSTNEVFGRQHGDDILKRFSRLLRGTIRFTDLLGCYDNDEFSILLPHTDLLGAEKFISRMLAISLEHLDTSFSAGVTTFRVGESKAQFLIRAKSALDHAKREGKKRIRCVISHDDGLTAVNL